MSDRITPAQMRGARGMLDWSIGELADAAQLSASTIKRMGMAGPQPVSEAAYRIMREALEKAGIYFCPMMEMGLECGYKAAEPKTLGLLQS